MLTGSEESALIVKEIIYMLIKLQIYQALLDYDYYLTDNITPTSLDLIWLPWQTT